MAQGYRSRLFRDDGVVLRVQKLGESDRIVTVLTRRTGRIRAVARGVRRTSSKFGARLEPFGHVEFQFAEGRNGLHTVSQVEAVELYAAKIAQDYPAYTAASAVCETAERLTPEEGEVALRLFQLTLGALRALAGREHASPLVLDAYFLRAMTTAGWAPALVECAVCATPGPHRAFSVASGGSVCSSCQPPGAARPAPATLGLMSALNTGDWKLADASDVANRREASGLVAAHLQWHLERALRSLPLVDRTANDRATTDRAMTDQAMTDPVRGAATPAGRTAPDPVRVVTAADQPVHSLTKERA
ncbi:DNA repair protein RecO [Longispora urticae]